MASVEDIANRVNVDVGGEGVVQSPDQSANFLISADKNSITNYSREGNSLVISFENGKTVKIIDFFGSGLDSNNLIFVDNGSKWLTHFSDALTPNEDGIVDTDIYYEEIGWNYSGTGLLAILGGAAVVAGSLATLLSDDGNEVVAKADRHDIRIFDADGGVLAEGAHTSNPMPMIGGSNATPNGKVSLAIDDNDLVTVDVSSDGTWAYSPPAELADGVHDITVAQLDSEGNAETSSTMTFTIDTAAPAAVVVEAVGDNAGSATGEIASGDSTDDATPLLSGNAEPDSLIRVYDESGNVIGTTTTSTDGSWSLEVSQPLGEGEHILRVTASDAAGNESEPSDEFVLVVDPIADNRDDDVAAAANSPGVGARSFMAMAFAADFEDGQSSDESIPVDDARSLLANGGTTDDNTPVLSGAEVMPGATVIIYDNGALLGEAAVALDGTWSYVPASPLSDGTHELSMTIIDSAGNVSTPSELFTLVVDTALSGVLSISDDGADRDDIFVLTGSGSNENGQGAASDDIADYLSPSGQGGDAILDGGAGQDAFFEPLAASSLADTQLDLVTLLSNQQIVV